MSTSCMYVDELMFVRDWIGLAWRVPVPVPVPVHFHVMPMFANATTSVCQK